MWDPVQLCWIHTGEALPISLFLPPPKATPILNWVTGTPMHALNVFDYLCVFL